MILLTLILAGVAVAVFVGFTLLHYGTLGARMAIAVGVFVVLVGSFMAWIFYAAHQMPDDAEIVVPIQKDQ